MTLAVETVLTPVDGSDTSMRAIEYAVAIAERYDAGVHLLYVVDEETARGAAFGDVDDTELAAANEAFIADAHELAPEGVPLSHSSAYGFSAMTKTRHPGSVVLDAAEDVEVDFIVIPRQPVSGDPDEPLGRAAEYVLQYATQPVLSV